MFSAVTQYRNKDYCTEHPVIEFETAEGMKQYTVFAVVYVMPHISATALFIPAPTKVGKSVDFHLTEYAKPR